MQNIIGIVSVCRDMSAKNRKLILSIHFIFYRSSYAFSCWEKYCLCGTNTIWSNYVYSSYWYHKISWRYWRIYFIPQYKRSKHYAIYFSDIPMKRRPTSAHRNQPALGHTNVMNTPSREWKLNNWS